MARTTQAAEVGSATGSSSGSQDSGRHDSGKSVHHGRTVAAWVGSLTATVAFFIGGGAVIAQNWVVFGIAVALLALAAIATKVLQRMGYGAD